MKVGVFVFSLYGFSKDLFDLQNLDEMFKSIANAGAEAIEIPCPPNSKNCNLDILLNNRDELSKILKLIADNGLSISALNCAGNPLHPQEETRIVEIERLKNVIQLAQKIKVDNVIVFSGCPGSFTSDENVNWIVYPYPNENIEILKWQWEKIAIPFWKEIAVYAKKLGVKLCFELHPGNLVYNYDTFIKLRNNTNENVGVNFDPSHFFWQGIDPIALLHKIKESIFHVHIKDVMFNNFNCSLNGVLDNKSFKEKADRSWIFRTVGRGQSYEFWKCFINTLRLIGYDGVLSIEQEDPLFTSFEGFRRGVITLKKLLNE